LEISQKKFLGRGHWEGDTPSPHPTPSTPKGPRLRASMFQTPITLFSSNMPALAGFHGPTSKGREGRGGNGIEGEGTGGREGEWGRKGCFFPEPTCQP